MSVLSLLSEKPELEKLLLDIVEWEKAHPAQSQSTEGPTYDGFQWFDVHGDPRTLNLLVTRGVLNVVFKSNKATLYRLPNLAEAEKALEAYQGLVRPPEEGESEIPPDLFRIIIGHDEKKEILNRSIRAERPVHGLLWGSVASAKTLFLEELSRLGRSHFVVGSNLSEAGLFEVLFNERPRYLILDELDKINSSEDLSCLLSLMERGRVTETKYRRHRSLQLKTWVFASANTIARIPPELMSRFLKLHFQDYMPEEFLEVSVAVLREREQVPETVALYIADKVMKDLRSRDVRDCCKIARLLKRHTREEADYVLSIVKRQV